MIFNSEIFLIFFALFIPLYFFRKDANYQNMISLLASYLFYGWWDWRFLFLISGCILVSYYATQFMTRHKQYSKLFLSIGVSVNLAALAFFKYYNFFAESLIDMLSSVGIQVSSVSLNIVLPVGISFFVFQAISYLIDIYRGKLENRYSLLTFATYISLFPQLVAGPIVRAKTLLPQLALARSFNFKYFILGIEAFIVGMAMKVIIADKAGVLVDRIFLLPELHSSLNLSLGAVLFAFQIYADFAGYSLMAIGIALIMGLKFRKNFNRPYFSTSFSEFWGRWHISLSSWLRDYLYIALGGNRQGNWRTYRNLSLTMLLGGLWHGASWNFVIWGVLHWAYLCIERFGGTNKGHSFTALNFFNKNMKRLYIFLLVCAAWVFFRAETFNESLIFLEHMVSNSDYQLASLRNKVPLLISCCLVSGLIFYEMLMEDSKKFGALMRSKTVRLFKFCTLIYLMLLFGSFGSTTFIYFQF